MFIICFFQLPHFINPFPLTVKMFKTKHWFSIARIHDLGSCHGAYFKHVRDWITTKKMSPHLCPTTVNIGCQSAIKIGKLGAEPKALFKVLQNSNGEVRRLQRSGETLYILIWDDGE